VTEIAPWERKVAPVSRTHRRPRSSVGRHIVQRGCGDWTISVARHHRSFKRCGGLLRQSNAVSGQISWGHPAPPAATVGKASNAFDKTRPEFWKILVPKIGLTQCPQMSAELRVTQQWT
jgi:hypothetical protein